MTLATIANILQGPTKTFRNYSVLLLPLRTTLLDPYARMRSVLLEGTKNIALGKSGVVVTRVTTYYATHVEGWTGVFQNWKSTHLNEHADVPHSNAQIFEKVGGQVWLELSQPT